jgi:hypothetical protein
MARLRQLYPQNYGSSTNINAELENVIRYLNAAELGNRTVGELLAQLFNDSGTFVGPIEIRRDEDEGIQYRVGEYTDPEEGWTTLVELEDIRGAPGISVGEVGLPLLTGRADYVPTNGTTTVAYAFTGADALIVYKNGILLRTPADYTFSSTGGPNGSGLITFGVAFNGTDKVTVFKVRAEVDSGYQRTDYVAAEIQSIFAFPHTDNNRLFVYRNGILLREGAGHDYTSSAETDTVTLLAPATPGTAISILTIEHPSLTTLTGLMLEETFVDSATGKIKWNTIGIADGQIPAAKVATLVSLINSAARIIASPTTPVGPAQGNLWLDTSASPNELKFYDGVQWLRTAPISSLPSFEISQALRYLRVNGTGTGLEYATIDLSSVIPLSQKGAAAGVATLDNTAKLPASQLPASISRTTLHRVISGSITDGTNYVSRIFNQRISIDSVTLRLGGGSCNARLAINGVPFGSTFAVSVTPTEIKFGQGGNPDLAQAVDATGNSRSIDVVITGASGASNLDVAVGASITP